MQLSNEKGKQLAENRYEFLINNIQDVIVELDLERTIKYINSKVYTAFGFKPEEVIGKNISDFIHPEDKKRMLVEIKEAIQKRKEIASELRVRHKDGHYILVAIGGSMAQSNGILVPMAVISNITERKKSEKLLRDLANKYDNIINHTSDIIAEVDMQGRFTYISPQVQKYLGESPERFIGKKWYALATSDVGTIKKQLHNTKYVDGIAFEYRSLDISRKNEFWFEVKGKRFVDTNGIKKDLIIARDITEKKKAEEDLKKALESQNFYRRLFTHDINNILHIMQTSISLLGIFQDDPSKAEEMEDLVKLMKEQIVRGTLLVENVRRLAEVENDIFPTQLIDVCEMLRNAIKFVKEGFQNTKFDINIHFEGGLFLVDANELLLNVFENILINSAKYNDRPIANIKIGISTEIHDDIEYVKVNFADNGIGISDDRKKSIFEEEKTSLKGSKGMGFGLTLVKKIIERYNGKIWVEDRIKGDYQKGCVFTILIPKQNLWNLE